MSVLLDKTAQVTRTLAVSVMHDMASN